MLGIIRSLIVYYGIPLRHRRLKKFYRAFRAYGDLMFDVGAHLGNRSRAWLSTGGRVVALEPQEQCVAVLRRFYGSSPGMEVVPAAVGSAPGVVDLFVSSDHPTMSTTAADWISDLEAAGLTRRIRWDHRSTVPVTTLDRLIGQFGVPAFIKIDVEGGEADVLAGLTEPVPVVAFEYLPSQIQRTSACVECLQALGTYSYNYCVGERRSFALQEWIGPEKLIRLLRRMGPKERSGDVYAKLK